MKVTPRLLVLITAPLILVDLGLFVVGCFMMGSALIVAVEVFPSLWPMTLVAMASALLYLAGLFFVAADALEYGVHGLRNPRRLLNCSLFGLAMNSIAVVLGFVVMITTLAIAGALF